MSAPRLLSTACAQAVAVAAAEESLYAGGLDGTDVYPAALVVATSAAGVWAVRRLAATERVGPAAAWLLQCVYAAKLSMLLIPEVLACAPANPCAVKPVSRCLDNPAEGGVLCGFLSGDGSWSRSIGNEEGLQVGRRIDLVPSKGCVLAHLITSSAAGITSSVGIRLVQAQHGSLNGACLLLLLRAGPADAARAAGGAGGDAAAAAAGRAGAGRLGALQGRAQGTPRARLAGAGYLLQPILLCVVDFGSYRWQCWAGAASAAGLYVYMHAWVQDGPQSFQSCLCSTAC